MPDPRLDPALEGEPALQEVTDPVDKTFNMNDRLKYFTGDKFS